MPVKIPSNIKLASKLMLNLIIERAGGFSEVGRLSDLPRQTLYAACLNGFIPLTVVHKVSKALGITPWGLSYVKLYAVFGEESLDFEFAVERAKAVLTAEDRDKIFKIYRKK